MDTSIDFLDCVGEHFSKEWDVLYNLLEEYLLFGSRHMGGNGGVLSEEEEEVERGRVFE